MERDVLLDRLKGYACALVLFGHVIMGIRVAGIDIPSFFHGLEKFIWSFHVSLFLFLSGAVYKLCGEWRGKKTRTAFILHKLINLGIPYVVFSALYIIINSVVGEVNTSSSFIDILKIWKTPVAQYWFLYALLIWAVISRWLKNWQITLLFVLAGYLLPLAGIGFGSFEVVIYSALSFGLGTCVNVSYLQEISSKNKVIVILLHLVAGICLVCLNLIEKVGFKEIMLIFGIYASIMLISLLQNIKKCAVFLDFMNKYSFQTYLLHTIFTAGIRVILLKIGITQWYIHVLAGVEAGIIFPVMAAMLAQKTKVLNIFFFPEKTYKILKQKNRT